MLRAYAFGRAGDQEAPPRSQFRHTAVVPIRQRGTASLPARSWVLTNHVATLVLPDMSDIADLDRFRAGSRESSGRPPLADLQLGQLYCFDVRSFANPRVSI